jgi:hypothetical protein
VKFWWLAPPFGSLVVQPRLATGLSRHSNFYKEVGKEWRVCAGVWIDARNMIVGTQLAGQQGGKAVPLPLSRNDCRIAWHEVGSPVRIIAVLRATMKSQVPVGYEDETGFHYGTDMTDWPFSI